MDPNFKYIKRELEAEIRKCLNHGKVIILYGARQVGKTTLIRNLFSKKEKVLYLSCEQVRIQEQIVPDLLSLKTIIGNDTNIIFDEAQYLVNPGLV